MTKQELIDHLQHLEKYTHYSEDAPALREVIEMLTERGERTGTHAHDTISRQAIDKFIDELCEIFADLRERHVDDSVCGLCEYDGAYLGQSGNWCNECPGFEKDDCFKLSGKIRKEWTDEIIKTLPSAQQEIIRCEDCKHRPTPTRADEGITYGFSVEFPDEKCPCQCEDGWYNWYPKNDFYCGYAERREE